LQHALIAIGRRDAAPHQLLVEGLTHDDGAAGPIQGYRTGMIRISQLRRLANCRCN
jgi:hypothetical protein